MPKRFLKADFFWPLAILAVFTMAVLVALVLSLVHQFDSVSREREQALVANGLTGITSEVAHRVVPQALWDEAVRNLDNRFNPVWASENVWNNVSFITNASGNHISANQILRSRLVKNPSADLFVNQRMILCDLPKIRFFKKIAAGIADICHIDIISANVSHNHRCAHACKLGVLVGSSVINMM